jgi:hypothetical protein
MEINMCTIERSALLSERLVTIAEKQITTQKCAKLREQNTNGRYTK